MSIDFAVYTEKGQVIPFYNEACFARLNGIHEARAREWVASLSHIDKPETKDTLRSVIYMPFDDSSSLSTREISNWITGLLSIPEFYDMVDIKYWQGITSNGNIGKSPNNYDLYARKYGLPIKMSYPVERVLAVGSILRCIDEFPWHVQFYTKYFETSGHRHSRLAFYASLFFKLRGNVVMEGTTGSLHHPTIGKLTPQMLYNFQVEFPYENHIKGYKEPMTERSHFGKLQDYLSSDFIASHLYETDIKLAGISIKDFYSKIKEIESEIRKLGLNAEVPDMEKPDIAKRSA